MRILATTAAALSLLLIGGCSDKVAPPPPPRDVIIRIDARGDIAIEGTRFAERDLDGLRAKVAEIQSRKPRPLVHIVVAKDIRFEIVGRAIVDLQSVGLDMKVGFITEPAPIPRGN